MSPNGGDRSAPARPLDGIGRAGRIGLATAAIGGAFVLGTIVLRVADDGLRDPIELAAAPDPAAAQGTGDGFHEVDGERIDRLAGEAGADDPALADPTTTGAGGSAAAPGGPTTAAGSSAGGPAPTGGPGVTVPAISTPTVTTPAVTTPAVTLPPVTVPTISAPTVSLPPLGSPLPPPPTVALPTISVPPISVPEIDPSLPVTVPTLPPVTLPPLFPSATETP